MVPPATQSVSLESTETVCYHSASQSKNGYDFSICMEECVFVEHLLWCKTRDKFS